MPYIVVWRDLLTDPLSWIQGFLPSRILQTHPQAKTTLPAESDKKKEVLKREKHGRPRRVEILVEKFPRWVADLYRAKL